MRSFIILFLVCLSIVSKAQKFENGYYYDLEGKKVAGKIKNLTLVGSKLFADKPHIIFQSDSAEKVKLYANMVKSFVVGADSFVVNSEAEPKFIHIVLDGPVKLYAYYKRGPSSTMSGGGLSFMVSLSMSENKGFYSYGTDVNNVTPLTRKNYAKFMTDLLADEPQVVALIKDKTYTFGEIWDMVDTYKKLKKRRVKK
jgi:hypothetical protein